MRSAVGYAVRSIESAALSPQSSALSPQQLMRFTDHRVIVIHMVVVPDGFQIVARENVGVHHPPERLRYKPPVGRIAFFFRRHSKWTEYGASVPGLVPALHRVASRDAP